MAAQDLEPRAYTASPIGSDFAVAGVTRSSGDVLFDPTIPFTDFHAKLHSAFMGGGTTFNLLGRTALALAVVPYAIGSGAGKVDEQALSVSRSGLADSRFKLSVNFVGGRAMNLSQFSQTKIPTIVGASFTVIAPTGQYDSHRLVNLGSNRWSFKPEVGVSRRLGNWTIDEYAGVWLFTPNNNFFSGSSVRTQEPVLTFQAHASYSFKLRLWTALDWTWYYGGTTKVNGINTGDLQRNTRIGGTISLPLSSRQSLKFTFSQGVTTRIGANFTNVAATWQFSRFRGQRLPATTPGHP